MSVVRKYQVKCAALQLIAYQDRLLIEYKEYKSHYFTNRIIIFQCNKNDPFVRRINDHCKNNNVNSVMFKNPTNMIIKDAHIKFRTFDKDIAGIYANSIRHTVLDMSANFFFIERIRYGSHTLING